MVDRTSVQGLTRQLGQEASGRINTYIAGFLEEPQNLLAISVEHLETGFIDITDQTEMERYFRNSIRSMALVHQKLYQSDNLSSLKMDEYLTDLVRLLKQSLGSDYRSISISVKADPFLVSLETVVPCGLVVNELIVNGMKHAFRDEEQGNIEIEARRISDSMVELIVRLRSPKSRHTRPSDHIHDY